MLWASLWRKPLCTTGMTWICRTWWIISKKRCSGQLAFHITQAVCLMLFWPWWEFSTRGNMLYTVPILCGSPHVIPSAHTGTLLSLGFPMGEAQSGRMYRIEQDHVSKYISAPPLSLSLSLPQFKCCGWNNYTDWSWNLYFNCTFENPSSERCAVPYSCCTPIPGEVRAFLCSLISYTV